MNRDGKTNSFDEYKNHFFSDLNLVQGFENGIENDFEITVSKIISLLRETRSAKRNVFVIGNGASATMASHLTIDFWKNLEIKAHLFSDQASLTAVGNDISFDECFSEPLSLYGNSNDLLISISSSGNSKNIINGIETANKSNLTTISLTGMKKTNSANLASNYSLYYPGQSYGSVESAHALILHYIIDSLVLN